MRQEERNILADILGGQILVRMGLVRQWKFLLYIFSLLIISISINFTTASVSIEQRRNQHELKNLKADYTSKAAKLLSQSRKAKIEERLKGCNSKLMAPINPPRKIVLK